MSVLAIGACVVGLVHILVFLPALLVPTRYREAVGAFPRSPQAARVLTAVDLAWVVTIIHRAPLGRFEVIKQFPERLIPALARVSFGHLDFIKDPVIWVGVIVFFTLVFFLDELLAARSLGGLLLLAANPLLNAARWHDSVLRLVVTVMAYVWVIAGIMLVLSPYYFRRVSVRCVASDARCRRLGQVGLAFGILLVVLGLVVY